MAYGGHIEIDLSKLFFNEIQGDLPSGFCAVCGSKGTMVFCSEHPMDDDILIMVCSIKCKDEFIRLVKEETEMITKYLLALYFAVQDIKK